MKYIALLRGVSPMNAPNVKLRSVFEKLGFSTIQSVISSGNIIFESTETDMALLEQKIEKGLHEQLGLALPTIVRNKEQIQEMIALDPFKGQIHSGTAYLTVTFFKDIPYKNPKPSFEASTYLPRIQALCTTNDTSTRETANFMAKLEREFGKGITTRTWNTMIKIHNKLA